MWQSIHAIEKMWKWYDTENGSKPTQMIEDYANNSDINIIKCDNHMTKSWNLVTKPVEYKIHWYIVSRSQFF